MNKVDTKGLLLRFFIPTIVLSMIMSYPPNVIKKVEQLPQYAGCIKEREKKHIIKKYSVYSYLCFYWQWWRISLVAESL